jgi:hypothetical protein
MGAEDELWRARRGTLMGRSLRKLIALLFVLLGAQCVRSMVDMTPWLGSPQLDYPVFDLDQPFWPQLALLWVMMGVGGGLLTALGILAWSDEPIERPGGLRTFIIAAACFVLVAGIQFAGFVAYGTMGPLHVQQPVLRLALVNGAVSSLVITVMWSLACVVVGGANRALSRPKVVLASLAVVSAAALAVIIVIALATGLLWRAMVGWWWSGALFLGMAAALLTALVPRPASA